MISKKYPACCNTTIQNIYVDAKALDNLLCDENSSGEKFSFRSFHKLLKLNSAAGSKNCAQWLNDFLVKNI